MATGLNVEYSVPVPGPISTTNANMVSGSPNEELERFWSSWSTTGNRYRGKPTLSRQDSWQAWETAFTPYSDEALQRTSCQDLESDDDAIPSTKKDRKDWEQGDDEASVLQEDIKLNQEDSEALSSQKVHVHGANIQDVPTSYQVQGLRHHEVPVIGTYVDPRIIPGFKYRVRPLQNRRYLFQGTALQLMSIGMGYGKRLTFASDNKNSNDNYFWSDTNPEGYGFEIEAISVGEKFTLFDANQQPVGTCKVTDQHVPQVEKNCFVCDNGNVEKHVHTDMLCKVEFFETGLCKVTRVVGTAVVTKPARKVASSITRVMNVTIGTLRGLSMTPGIDMKCRHIVLRGEKIGDVPTQYTITGLESYEMPVIGTYIDPHIIPGFHYRVRPAHCRKSLFAGAALQLLSIGRGYGKRLTFKSPSLNDNQNYFWSDSQLDGFGFMIQAVFPGMKFEVFNEEGEFLGHASVFRADSPQKEQKSQVLPNGDIQKLVQVDVTCNINFNNNLDDAKTLRISGTAVLVKTKKSRKAHLLRIVNIGMGSQINLVFQNQKTALTFYSL